MAKLKIYVILLICIGYIQSISSQSPFDLRHRLEQPKQTSQDSFASPPPVKNPFQIPSDSLAESDSLGRREVNISIDTGAPKVGEKVDSAHEADDTLPLSSQRKSNLIFGTFILLVLYLTVVISFRRSVVNEIFRSILNDNYLNLLLRKLRSRGLSQFVFLYFFSIINGGLFLFLVSEQTNYLSLEVNLLTISVMLGLIYTVRHLSLGFIGGIFPIEKTVYQFSFTILIFNLFLGLILFPVNLFIAFSPDALTIYFIYLALFLIGLFYILRQLRGLFIAAPLLSQHKFHFLLYLCTIEIAPLAVLYKFFQPYFS